jgi:hypothetical protein
MFVRRFASETICGYAGTSNTNMCQMTHLLTRGVQCIDHDQLKRVTRAADRVVQDAVIANLFLQDAHRLEHIRCGVRGCSDVARRLAAISGGDHVHDL